MVIRRGDIFLCRLAAGGRLEQGGVRPVLIIQNDVGNRHSPTVICAAITSQMNKAKASDTCGVDSQKYALVKDSVVLLEQLRTIDGMITECQDFIAMEDILEELVGNIEDEHDEEENYIRKNDDETFIMDGMTEFSDVKEALSLPVDDDAYETLNGFIISLSDKIPEEGDKTVISAYGYRFSVMSVEDKVIKQVMIKKLAPEEKK